MDKGECISAHVDRDESFDVLKGIAIILVVVGHCDIGRFHSFIDSFHMPLFFFAAGFFLKKRPLREEFRLSLKRLLVPYIFVAFCTCAIAICVDLLRDIPLDFLYIWNNIVKFLLGLRSDHVPEWLHGDIGILWFLLAMFWSRSLIVLVINKVKRIGYHCVIVAFMVFLGMLLHKFLFIPYGISQGLFATGFLYIGFLTNRFDLLNSAKVKKSLPLLLLFWIYSWSRGGLSMVSCWFSTECVSGTLGAYGVFFAIYLLVKRLSVREKYFWNFFCFCGRYSLIIYCVHAIEINCSNWNSWAHFCKVSPEYFLLFQIPTRLAIILAFSLVVLKIRLLRERIFQIKNL